MSQKDIFTRNVHGIRLRYAAVSTVFLALVVALFMLGGPNAFGWREFLVVFLLILLLLTLFLLHSHYVLVPIERLTKQVNSLLGQSLDSTEPLRIKWNGKDEFACLAASLNGLLETVQSRSIGMAEENRRLRDVVSSAEVELVVMNRNGSVLNILHCPASMQPVPGLARGFEPDSAIWGEENRKAFKAGLAAAFQNDGKQQSVNLAFKVGGSAKTRRLKAFITRPRNDIFPLVVFREDETPPPSERPAERKVPLSRIAAGIASDLRNVFSVIRNSAGRYADSPRPEVRETVGNIYQAIQSGVSMMDELETLGGDVRLKLVRINAADLVNGTNLFVKGVIEGSGVKLNYDLHENLPIVIADPNQIAKVFVALARNTVEAFGIVPGKIDVVARPYSMTADEGVEFSPPLPAGEGILISFSDNGPGMQEHVRSRVFEPYCTTKANGRGFGLPIACSIVEAHGGGMRALSTKGVGSTFEIFLRRSMRPLDEADLLRKEFPGGEVLVVDDSKSILKITSMLLRTQKIAAHVADCRRDAICKFSELSNRLRAVFLDAQLDDTKTSEILAEFRIINPNVPVIVVSGYTRQQIDEIFAEHPIDGFLSKPYTIAELKDILDEIGKKAWGGG